MKAEELFLYSFLFFLGAFVLFFLLKLIMRKSRSDAGIEIRDTSKVGFVVDTFHELVSKLKEKEKELNALRKIAEQKAEDIESYNKNILQSVPSGVISFDCDLKIKSMNFSAEKILGLQSENVIARTYEEILGGPISNIIKEGKFIERGEVQCQTVSGRKVWLGLTFSPLRDNSGNEIGRLLVFTDLTELKALESQAELRKQLSSLGEMSAGIAHELKNPLAVIAGYAKLLSKKIDSSLSPTVQAISREVDAMDRIIVDFLSFARPVELNVSAVKLSEVIDSCILNTIANSDVEVNNAIDGSFYIKGDEVLLRQAFTNLIQNAVDAVKGKGKLSFSYTRKNDDVEIMVSDTGHGIPQNILDKIFLPFYTTKDKGTGLGLAIVHKIIVSHGGTISVSSTSVGTTFKLRFPLK